VLDVLTERIAAVERILEENAELTEEVEWLMSIPGIGFHTVVLIQGELGEVARFSSLDLDPRALSATRAWRQR